MEKEYKKTGKSYIILPSQQTKSKIANKMTINEKMQGRHLRYYDKIENFKTEMLKWNQKNI